MIPNDLESKYITCPPTDDYSIVIITGNQMRHQLTARRTRHSLRAMDSSENPAAILEGEGVGQV